MNPVRSLRSQAGVTQQALAVRAGTSQPAIASYESGRKSPNFATLQRMAASLGLEVSVTYVPRLTREDRRSLAYHQAVARKLRQEPRSPVLRARRTLEKMRNLHPGARRLLDRWGQWLDLPAEELIARILDPSVMARDMRQVTPFAGLLGPRERAQVLKGFRREHRS